MNTMKPLTIGEIARRSGVGIQAIRYYEREGLLASPRRTSGGYRQYAPETEKRLRFIRHAKDLGFSLKEIRELLELRVNPRSTCRDIKRRAEAKIADVDGRIARLEKIRGALVSLSNACRGRGPSSDCPILEALDQEDN